MDLSLVVSLSLLIAPGAQAADQAPTIALEDGVVRLTSGRMELVVHTSPSLDASLRGRSSGRSFADSGYVWPGGGRPILAGEPRILRDPSGRISATFAATLGDLAIEQTFEARPESPDSIVETISIRNAGSWAVETRDFRCGFAKALRRGSDWTRDAESVLFSAVPYRRETDGVIREFPLRKVAEQPSSYTGWAEPVHETPTWGSEGWVWSEGGSSLLIAKYNPNSLEWSLLTPVTRADPSGSPETVLCFGGAGLWKHGSPEGALRLDGGKSFAFGETLFRIVDGPSRQAYLAYREYTEGKGCRTPPGYDPPVHWNELYENDYFFKAAPRCFEPDFPKINPGLLKALYSLDHMKAQAAAAREMGCEALYLDPGWETGPSHHVWGADRLGSEESFLALMKKDYGLRVSVWIGLAGAPPTYADPAVLPVEARRMEKDGTRVPILCVASPMFRSEKKRLLGELARGGLAFLMFDSTQYTGPCHDPSHGHSIPSTREEHVAAILDIISAVKAIRPDILIELHDPVTGPSSTHYTPAYFGYARKNSFDCLWGHEFMWDSMGDLLSGRALSLYWYNLAYSIPLYLHIGLKSDSANALAFWWYASTCRHLGMGGRHPDPAVRAAHAAALRSYLSLKRFYTQGVFWGIDETVHAHTLADLRESAMNVFNLTDRPEVRDLRFRLRDIGLPQGRLGAEGAEARQDGGEVVLKVSVPAKGQTLVKLKVTD
jgi:hypothetical protein